MTCKHERLKTVNHRVFCVECGEELPMEFLMIGKSEEKEEPKPKTTAKRRKKEE